MISLSAAYGQDLSNVAIVTLAPELPGALPVITALANQGITPAMGHSMANLSDGEAGARAGSTLITHLFNAMLPVSFARANVYRICHVLKM